MPKDAKKFVWVTVWDHRHGQDISVFATEEAAEKYRQNIAAENWEYEMDEDRPSAPEELADRYFEVLGERGPGHAEYFDWEKREIEG